MQAPAGACRRAPSFHAIAAPILSALMLAVSAPAMAQQVRINQLNDFAFGTLTANGTTNVSRTDNLCAYTSATTLGYRVTASGSGSSGAFTLANGGNALAYTVQWSGTSGATSGVQLTSGTALAAITTSTANSACLLGTGTNATVIVTLPAANVTAVPAGAYSGTLTLTIVPN